MDTARAAIFADLLMLPTTELGLDRHGNIRVYVNGDLWRTFADNGRGYTQVQSLPPVC